MKMEMQCVYCVVDASLRAVQHAAAVQPAQVESNPDV